MHATPIALTPLGHQILTHWTQHRPAMVTQLRNSNRLMQAVFAAQELTGDLLHELMVIRKMDYQAAWEIATKEWAFLPSETDLPELAFDPATLDRNRALPAISE